MHFKNIPHLLFALYTQYKKYIYTAVIARPKNPAYGTATYSRILRTLNSRMLRTFNGSLLRTYNGRILQTLNGRFYKHLTLAFYEHLTVTF